MEPTRITNWDDAYANADNIPDSSAFPDRWAAAAASTRERLGADGRFSEALPYGNKPRNWFDLARPQGDSRGLVVFVHGGYWKAFDARSWSHLSLGALEHGYAVALPSYTLCPDARIGDITVEMAAAVTAAANAVDGPVHLAGHSAGGHLVTRLVSHTSPLGARVRERVANVVSISGVHDLRPLTRTAMNDVLGIDSVEANAESPLLLEPGPGVRLTCWVGANELPEFRRQNAALANVWHGLGAATTSVERPGRHHFDVIDELADSRSPLVKALLAASPDTPE